MRYGRIEPLRRQYPIAAMCRVLEVSESGFHAWRGRPPSPRARENARLAVEIKAAHERTRQTYGPECRPVASAGLTPPPSVAVLNSRNPLRPMVK